MPRRLHGAADGGGQPDLGNISESATGIPDEAIGPDQSSLTDLLDLSQGQDVEAMAAKLQAEADARRSDARARPRGKPDGDWGG